VADKTQEEGVTESETASSGHDLMMHNPETIEIPVVVGSLPYYAIEIQPHSTATSKIVNSRVLLPIKVGIYRLFPRLFVLFNFCSATVISAGVWVISEKRVKRGNGEMGNGEWGMGKCGNDEMGEWENGGR